MQEIQALDPNVYNGFDRLALHQNPANRDAFYKASDIGLPIIIVSAGVLAFDKRMKNDLWRLLFIYYEMHAVTFSIYNFSPFGPAFQNKYRPYVYYDVFPLDQRMGGNNRNSMYSGHVATSAASTFFIVKVYSDYHPEIGNNKYWLYALASVPPLFEGFLRVKALAHFPSDVLMGFAIGAITGVTVPELHRIRNKNIHIGMTYTPSGPGLGLTWNIKGKSPSMLNTYASGSQHPVSVY